MEETLYKYLDVKGAVSMLKSCKLRYTNPKAFNDPFDCAPELIDFSDEKTYAPSDWPEGWYQKKVIGECENRQKNVYICSLSKVCDSVLMWAHYSDKHSGVCIGFDRSKLSESINDYAFMSNSKGVDVNYTDIRNKPSYSNADFFDYQLITKSKVWEYEQEVRLYMIEPSWMLDPIRITTKEKINGMGDLSEVRFHPSFNPLAIKEVFLGVNIQSKSQQRITELAKRANPNVRIYKMGVDSINMKLVPELVGK